MGTKVRARTWAISVLLVIAVIALVYHSNKHIITLYGRYYLNQDDPMFIDAKKRLANEHAHYLEAAGSDLFAIKVPVNGDYCVKFYSTRSFTYSKNIPLYCYEFMSETFRRQIG